MFEGLPTCLDQYFSDIDDIFFMLDKPSDDAAKRTWTWVKATIMLPCPGACLYSVDGSEGLVLKMGAHGIYTRENRVDQQFVETWFMLVFGENMRTKMEWRLYVKYPDHHLDDPGPPVSGTGCASCRPHTHVRVSYMTYKSASSVRPSSLVMAHSRWQREVMDMSAQQEVIDLTREDEVIDLTGDSDEELVEVDALF
jgi:hypothetical protein